MCIQLISVGFRIYYFGEGYSVKSFINGMSFHESEKGKSPSECEQN